MKFINDVHVGMRRAVQQESRDLYHSKSKQHQQGRGCLLIIMLSPLVLLGMTLYVLSMYNAWVRFDRDNASIELLRQAEQEDKTTRQQLLQKHLAEEEEGQEHHSGQQQQQLLRKRSLDPTRLLVVAEEAPPKQEVIESIFIATPKILVLTTPLGPIRVRLRPELSPGSVEYIHQLVKSHVCHDCKFYRSEKPGILQGIMSNPEIPVNTERGTCPIDVGGIENQCPDWDPECGCHGPVMTRGSVAWAGGQAGGPDFFINAYKQPAEWWVTQHTNFGMIDDMASMGIVEQIFDLPVTKKQGMHFLQDSIHFALSME